jgi:hypothetical protein
MGAGAVQAADAAGGEEVDIVGALFPTARSFIVRDHNVYAIPVAGVRSAAPVLRGGGAISKAWDADLSHSGDGAAARWKNVAQWPAKRNSPKVIDVAILDVGGAERHDTSHFL